MKWVGILEYIFNAWLDNHEVFLLVVDKGSADDVDDTPASVVDVLTNRRTRWELA